MIRQDAFFFERAGTKLFGSSFEPTDSEKKPLGVVLCNAFASETEIFRVHFVQFARRLAERGHSVLRFDYAGYGDSEGDFAEASPSTMQADIEAAMEELGRRSGTKSFALVGLRLGATLASRVAAARSDVERLVLWEPLVKPWDDLFADLRATVSMQTVLFKDVKMTRDQIVENVLAGRPSVVGGLDLNVIDDGYPLGKAFVEETRAIDLTAEPAPRAKTLLLHVRKTPGQPNKKLTDLAAKLKDAGTEVELDTSVEPTLPWKHEATYTTRSTGLYDKTFTWLGA